MDAIDAFHNISLTTATEAVQKLDEAIKLLRQQQDENARLEAIALAQIKKIQSLLVLFDDWLSKPLLHDQTRYFIGLCAQALKDSKAA